MLKTSIITLISLLISLQVSAEKGKNFDRIITVIFENKNYSDVIRQPFFAELARSGASFSSFKSITHPSQPNYIALTSGSTQGVTSDEVVNINSTNVADLLEAKGLTWKVYAEDYPGNCFTGATKFNYARKHNPFMSFINIQRNPERCKNIVNADQFDSDAANNALPNYVFYVPNNKNNGHDTNLAYADRWYGQKFKKYLSDSAFMQNTILISTFDESEISAPVNQIYLSIVGPSVKAHEVPANGVNTYSLLRMVEENWGLGSLGRNDQNAVSIPAEIWQ